MAGRSTRGSRGGSGLMCITGRWVLEPERSESLYPHMKAMGCEEIAALASEKLNLRINIVQTIDALNIWQTSQLGQTHRTLTLSRETLERSPNGDRKITVSVTEDKIVLSTRFERGQLVDTRVMLEDGNVMLTMLDLTINGGPATIHTRRFFRRTGPPDPEIVAAKVKGALPASTRNSAQHVVEPLLPPPADSAATQTAGSSAAVPTVVAAVPAAPPAAPQAMPPAGGDVAMSTDT